MNNFKLLTETKTVITKWAVPQEAALEDLETVILFETCVDQVRLDNQVIQPLKAMVEFRKTLEFEELSAEDQEETDLYDPTVTPMEHVMDAVEVLLVQPEELSATEHISKAIENLEALQREIARRIEELRN